MPLKSPVATNFPSGLKETAVTHDCSGSVNSFFPVLASQIIPFASQSPVMRYLPSDEYATDVVPWGDVCIVHKAFALATSQTVTEPTILLAFVPSLAFALARRVPSGEKAV